jgi:hypothetical protein
VLMRDSPTLVRPFGVVIGVVIVLAMGLSAATASGQDTIVIGELTGADHRRGWVIENGVIRVTLLRQGGHVAGIRLLGTGAAL